MNGWLAGSAVLLVAVVPLAGVAVRHPAEHGLVALQLAGVEVTLALLLFARGVDREALSDGALVLAAASVVGTLAFATLLEREP